MEEFVLYLQKMMDQIDKKAKKLGIENVSVHLNFDNAFELEDVQVLESDPTVNADKYEPYWLSYTYRRQGDAWKDRTEKMNTPSEPEEDEA